MKNLNQACRYQGLAGQPFRKGLLSASVKWDWRGLLEFVVTLCHLATSNPELLGCRLSAAENNVTIGNGF